MSRFIELSRDEGEQLVDLIDDAWAAGKTTDRRMLWVAEDIRKIFGMVPSAIPEAQREPR